MRNVNLYFQIEWLDDWQMCPACRSAMLRCNELDKELRMTRGPLDAFVKSPR